jgi:hypothetical protein
VTLQSLRSTLSLHRDARLDVIRLSFASRARHSALQVVGIEQKSSHSSEIGEINEHRNYLNHRPSRVLIGRRRLVLWSGLNLPKITSRNRRKKAPAILFRD